MEVIKVCYKPTLEERETLLNYDPINKEWLMDSSISKHFKKALKQGWTPIRQYIHEDGTVCGMLLSAPDRAITIRNTEKKKMSDKQLRNLSSLSDE